MFFKYIISFVNWTKQHNTIFGCTLYSKFLNWIVHCTVHYCTALYIVQFITVLYCALYSTILYCILYCIVQYSTALNTLLYWTVHFTVLCCTIYCTVLYTLLYCAVHFTVLYCTTILRWPAYLLHPCLVHQPSWVSGPYYHDLLDPEPTSESINK